MVSEDLKNTPSKIPLEQFDISKFSKDKIRDLFKSGRIPTADALVDEILLRSVKEGATDLHLEPLEGELRIRIGQEGVLKKLISLPREISENLASVLKTKSNLNTFEKKKPQEGRFSLTMGTHQFDVRISTIPVLMGERVALRILEKNTQVAHLDELGFSSELLAEFRSLVGKPSGLVLVTGEDTGEEPPSTKFW